MNEPFYIAIGKGTDVTVACAQWFDLPDYNPLTDTKFKTENEAWKWIHDEYLTGKTNLNL